MKLRVFIVFMSLFIFFCSKGVISNKPISNEATFLESFSASEVTIEAYGYGKDTESAISDAKKSAIQFVLKYGTDPLLKTDIEKRKFEQVEEDFYANDNIEKYITYVSEPKSVVVTNKNGKKLKKVKVIVRVDKRKLGEFLVSSNIIKSLEELKEAEGTPFIMVIPETKKGEDPLTKLQNDKLAQAGAAAIESYLTSKGYDVQVPQASEVLDKLQKLQLEISSNDQDKLAELAQIIGSDVYFTYNISIENGTNGTRKASVIVKAYETTTGRLLGTETGYSPSMKINSDQALIENAIGDAVNNVLERVRMYWTKDLKKGLQYKITFSIVGYEGKKAESITDEIAKIVESEFSSSKELLFTNKTVEYVVWASKDEYSSGNSIYRMLRSRIEKSVPDAEVERIVVNRKFIHLKIRPR